MLRERVLKIVLIIVGLLFIATIYPLFFLVRNDETLQMMLSLYVTLGVFLVLASRNPSAHRSLIAFAAWSSFAHASTMSILGLEIPEQRVGFLVGSGILVVIGVALIALAPANSVRERASLAAVR